jgi:hypothetical protein
MARDRANINTNIWTDQDWRDLTIAQQHLYQMLLSHPTLSYAGVADWRLARLAAMTSDATPQSITEAAAGLQAERFVFVDEATEEILIRSFLRHDGILKQPKLSISMVNAYASIASKPIRQIVVHEIQRLHQEHPEWAAFGQEKVLALVKAEGKDMRDFTPAFRAEVTPPVTHLFTLNGGQADPLPTSTATTTATSSSPGEAKKPETKLPKEWAPTAAHIERARAKGVDVVGQAEAFRLHAETHDRRAASWNAAFTTWLIKAQPEQRPTGAVPQQYSWANQ